MNQPTIVTTELSAPLERLLDQVAGDAGGTLIQRQTATAWTDALDQYFPWLALLDVDRTPDWLPQLRRAKLRPHTRYIPIIAVSAHDQAALSQAHRIGADRVMTYTELEAQLGELVQQALHPPTRYPDGWDDPLPPDAVAGLAYFNAGDYFEQHELLEAAWRAEPRPIRDLYQGILQIGVAFYQIELGNWDGAIKMFRRGLPKLRGLPPICQGIELIPFQTAAEQIHANITALRPANLPAFDQSTFPQIIIHPTIK